MAEILRNTTTPIYHQVFWNGESVEPDSHPVVTVFDITEDPESEVPSPTYYLTTITSQEDNTNVGTYYVIIPIQYTTQNSTLRLRWTYTVSGSSVNYYHDVYVVTPYTDLYQAANNLGISTDPSDPNYKTYKEIVEAERYARQKIENFTGQKFYLYNDVLRIMGSGSDVLPLPNRIYSIHRLYKNDVVLIDNLQSPSVNNWGYSVQVSETNFGVRVNRANMLDNTVYVANGMVPPTIHDGDGVFKSNTMYEIHGRFGWRKVPDKVEHACIELMKDYFSKDLAWKNQYIKNIQTFDWNFEYQSDVFRGTGNAYADQLLSDYVLNKVNLI